MYVCEKMARDAGYRLMTAVEPGFFHWVSPNMSVSNESYRGETEAWRLCCLENGLTTEEELRERRRAALEGAAGLWKGRTDTPSDGVAYQQQLRAEWESD